LDLFHLSNDFTFQGVPAGAVRHKMIGEGLDQATIEYNILTFHPTYFSSFFSFLDLSLVPIEIKLQ
jgi:hypothetical protein